MAALSVQSVEAVMSSEGATDAAMFSTYAEHVLQPTVCPCDIVVMETLRAYYTTGIRERIARRGAQLLHLPPYASDLAPADAHNWFIHGSDVLQ
jgi:transposase